MTKSVLERLADGVVQMDESSTRRAALDALSQQIAAYDAVEFGLNAGMQRVGELYETHEYFIPELLLCADAMYAGLDVLRPHLTANGGGSRGTVVIGVVQGDTHDIGKNLVVCMLEAAGFEIHDLGRNVPLDRFVDTAEETGAQIIALSTLMTSTMEGMARVVEMLHERGIRDRVQVMVGGAPVSVAFAERIGADAYAPNAASAVEVVKGLVAAVA